MGVGIGVGIGVESRSLRVGENQSPCRNGQNLPVLQIVSHVLHSHCISAPFLL
jgi:hypothetical protein